ncbi:hypothetical protein G3578_08380 [Brevibacillus sp. SYP-B805]|uniref:hypothetical protein n=1 Tax=Brevibacillus sp. SYP-B805 TaxID=1578199 RepID=UPI0013EDB3D2|nr:hypothetical protein [Brevibacillus sp. SYP-B805]NGQ95183.1 hypothetical protein [Brevibacillus sp. SYP-B805]
MPREFTEIPQVDIPDEITRVDLPEIGETTPHPRPDSPQAMRDASETNQAAIGFVE